MTELLFIIYAIVLPLVITAGVILWPKKEKE